MAKKKTFKQPELGKVCEKCGHAISTTSWSKRYTQEFLRYSCALSGQRVLSYMKACVCFRAKD